MNTEYPKKFLDLLNSVDAKRPTTVIKHILSKGFITSQELKDNYGYNHPPRAIRDVREYGIPIVTYRVEGNDGRSIAAYRFGDPNDLQNLSSKKAGRTVLSKELKYSEDNTSLPTDLTILCPEDCIFLNLSLLSLLNPNK